MTKRMRPRGTGYAAAGLAVLLATVLAAEQLADSLRGWGVALGLLTVAFRLLRASGWTWEEDRA